MELENSTGLVKSKHMHMEMVDKQTTQLNSSKPEPNSGSIYPLLEEQENCLRPCPVPGV